MNEPKKQRPQDKWNEKNGLVSKTYKLQKEIADQFAEACEKVGDSKKKVLETMMMDFVRKVNEMSIEYKVERQTLEEALKEDRREPIFAIKTTARTVSGIIEAIEKETDFFYGMDQEEKEEFILHADFHIYKDGVATWEN